MIWIITALSVLGVTAIFTYALAKAAGKASKEEWRRERLQAKLKNASEIAERMSEPLPDDDVMDEWVRDNK